MGRPALVILLLMQLCLAQGCRKNDHAVKIYFAGDLLLDRGVRQQINSHGAEALFAHVKLLFAHADAVVVNLECPVTTRVSPVNKKYIFRADPENLKAVRDAGITHLVLANNHTNDQGRAGIGDTYRNVLANGMTPAGYGSNQDGACTPTLIEKNGVTVALFSSVLVTPENWAYLADSPGVCQASAGDLTAWIKEYRNLHSTHKIVVMLHWGAEFQAAPMNEQRQQARDMIDAGADAIIGCHPHVIQSHTMYKGKPVFYSIGNFVFDQEYPAAKKGLIVELDLSELKDTFILHPFEIVNCAPVPEK